MQYREFGTTGVKLSTLGFGAMRLPTKEVEGQTVFDYEESIKIIRRAYDLGVNYFDTAPYYCDGESEIILGQAIKPFRDKIYLSTKNPIEDASGENWRKRLEASLAKLDTDYIDFYHMWGISLETYEKEINVPGGTMAMVEENASVASNASPLTLEEVQQINQSVEENKKMADLYCTGCNYCMPCPQGVNIPLNFQIMNYHRIYGITEYAKAEYAKIGTMDWMKGEKASACIECGICETKCPQKLEIIKQLAETAAVLGS